MGECNHRVWFPLTLLQHGYCINLYYRVICNFQEQISKIGEEIQSIESEIKAAKLRTEEVEKNLHKKEEEAEDYDENKFDDKLAEIDRKIEKQVNVRKVTGEKLKQLETDKDR